MPLETGSSLHRDSDMEPERGSLTGKFERQMEKGSGYGPSLSLSLCMGARGNWGEGSFTGNSESYVRHVKEGFGNGASLCLYRLREGNLEGGFQYWGLPETCNGRLWKQNISFIGLHKRNIRHLAREGSASMFNALGYRPLTGYDPRLLLNSLLDTTPWKDISTEWGWSTVPYVEGLQQRRKPQRKFCMSVEPWLHSDIPDWVSFLGPRGC